MRNFILLTVLLITLASCSSDWTEKKYGKVIAVEQVYGVTDSLCYAELDISLNGDMDDSFWVGCNCDDVNVGDTIYFVPSKLK